MPAPCDRVDLPSPAERALVLTARRSRIAPHASGAATVLIGLEGPVRVRRADCTGREQALVLAPDVTYATQRGGRVLMLLVEPDSDDYRFILPVLGGATLRVLAPAQAACLRREARRLLAGAAADLRGRLLATLCPRPAVALPWDARVLRVCQYLRMRLPHAMPSASELSAAVGLSASRLRHLFREQLGVSLRKYQRWLRVRYAFGLPREQTLAGVAAGSGFCDQAHFTRTIRSMTGYAPSALRPSQRTRAWWPPATTPSLKSSFLSITSFSFSWLSS